MDACIRQMVHGCYGFACIEVELIEDGVIDVCDGAGFY